MNILIATGLYPPDIGGPATYTVFLEKHLPKHHIACMVIPYGTVRKYPKIIRHLMYTLKLIISAKKVDMLYALDTVSVGLPVRIASMLTRTPYILRVPGDYAWEQGQQRFGISETLDAYLTHTQSERAVRMLARIQSHVARHALHVVVPSEYLKKIVMHWGVPAEHITRIYSALKEILVPESKDVLRTQCGYHGWTITTAGRLVPWKGMHALVRIVKKMYNAGIGVHLEVLGDGVCRSELEALAETLGVSAYVHFCGVLGRDEMARRIKASDIFVLNTSYEGLSHQLIEVMSLGTPIVTTDVGGNPELITSGETGTLVAYNDEDALYEAMLRFRDDETYRTVCTTNARERTTLFHEDAVVQEFITLTQLLWK